MKAIICPKYGTPDVLQFKEVAKPVPQDNEVLVKVQAASINAADHHFMRGEPLMVRLASGLLKPKYPILGADIAGRVEGAGKEAKEFQPGDEVFADLADSGCGGFAEYACVEEKILALKPAGLSFREAAAVPLTAVTALQGLRDAGKIQPGQKVLINGASGGVGTFAVQIAKSFQAEVTGVCSSKNLAMVRSIGADRVIDYTREDFTKNGRQYDLIFDTAANHSVWDCKRALSPRGIYVACAFSWGAMLLGPWISLTGGRKMGGFLAKANGRDLAFVKELIEAGRVKPVIDRSYTLSEVPQAIRHYEQGHPSGKIVINVA